MSYTLSGVLQTAVYQALAGASQVTDLVGSNIYDALPGGELPDTYVSLGDERVQDASDGTADGALHMLEVYVVTTRPGFQSAKEVAAAVSDVLHNADLALTRGQLVFLRFERAQARRIESNATRQIALRFRARVDDI